MNKLQLLARASLLVITFSLHSFADDRWLVRVHPSVVNDVAKKHSLRVDKRINDEGVYVVAGPANVPSTTLYQALKANTLVQRVEKNVTVTLPELSAAMPKSGHKFPKSVRSTPQIAIPGAWTPYLTQPANTLIKIPQAQAHYGYGFGVRVAVIDTWIDRRHPALAYAIDSWDTLDAISGGTGANVGQETVPWVDQETVPWVDGSGTIVLNQETVPWVDQETVPWVDHSRDIGAAYGHGTMVAGIIRLVAPGARIVPIRAFKSDGSGTIADVIEGIQWAIKKNVKVINMSFSAPTSSAELDAAIHAAKNAGIICVASLANDHSSSPVYPSNIAPTIGVAATAIDDTLASFSNFGPDAKIAAPGVAVVSTYPQNRYAAGWGTSFATPYVAGTVALMKSRNYWQDATETVKDLQDDSTPVKTYFLRLGRLDVYEALRNVR